MNSMGSWEVDLFRDDARFQRVERFEGAHAGHGGVVEIFKPVCQVRVKYEPRYTDLNLPTGSLSRNATYEVVAVIARSNGGCYYQFKIGDNDVFASVNDFNHDGPSTNQEKSKVYDFNNEYLNVGTLELRSQRPVVGIKRRRPIQMKKTLYEKLRLKAIAFLGGVAKEDHISENDIEWFGIGKKEREEWAHLASIKRTSEDTNPTRIVKKRRLSLAS